MLYRRYGRTNLEISALTFGAMRIPFNEKCSTAERDKGEANAVATVRRAMELGINHIDTARGYGNSERLIGLAVQELGRDKFYITTKVPIQKSADETLRHIEESLKRMNINRIDIVDLHGINTPERLKLATDTNACLGGLLKAKDEGLISHVSFSSHGGPELLIPAMETGFFSSASIHFWWTHQRNAISAARAEQLSIGILILSPTEKGGLLFAPTPQLSNACAPFTPLVLAHRWLLAQPGVTSLTVGAARPEEFDAHMGAVEKPDCLTKEQLSALEQCRNIEKKLSVALVARFVTNVCHVHKMLQFRKFCGFEILGKPLT
ncbi:MAG: aldo/keto reductase [Lentisphaerae bacterium]|nr:aldo/keto reductase [Lentisphaerota bacterium]